MKKLTLLFFAIFSTSMLLAQTKEMSPNPSLQTIPATEVETTIVSNNASLNNDTYVEDNTPTNLIAKEQIDKQNKAAALRLENSKNKKAADALAKEQRKQRTLKASNAISTKSPVSNKKKKN